jgi:hypothetical protein
MRGAEKTHQTHAYAVEKEKVAKVAEVAHGAFTPLYLGLWRGTIE